MSEEFSVVNVNVLGRDYPVKCTPVEAEALKKVEKELGQQLNQYRLKYVQLDKQDCLSMALIETRMEEMPSKENELINECISTIDHLESMLAPFIS